MMKTTLLTSVCVVWLGAGVVTTRGEGRPVADRSTIRKIHVQNVGGGAMDEGFVLAKISSKVGVELDRQVISKDVKALLATGRFSSVDASVDTVDDGVRVVFTVRQKFKLQEPVKVKGAEHFRESRIRDLLELQVGDWVDDPTLGVRTQKVIAEYRADYFSDATVSWRIEESDPAMGLARVTVSIDEGKRAPVKEVVVSGNQAVPYSDLRSALKQPSRWNPLWWFRQKRYEPDELEAARLEIRDVYLNRGYLDAVVALPVVERTAGEGLRVSVAIQEGTRYRWGTISLSGVTLFGEGALKKIIRARPGDLAAADVIAENAQAVRDYYGSRGYISTAVKPVLDADASKGIVNVTFVVTEGALTRVRNIAIRGNTRTRDKVIRRELLVYPGDVYDEVKIRRSERILYNLGYFETVRSSPVATRAADEKDLVFQVEEKRTGNIILGMGFSSVDNLMAFLDLSQGNFDIAGWPYFTGGGQKLKLHTQVGSTRKEYDLSLTEPWFLDRKLSLGADIYRREAEYTDYDVTRTGGAISLGTYLPGANRLDFRYQLEKAHLGDLSDTNEYFYVDSPEESYYFSDEPQDLTESTLTVSLTHDDRSNPFVPTKGNRTSLSAGISGGPLGFDTEMYDLSLASVQYVSLWYGHVLSLRTRWEVVDGYGSTEDLPIDDRLFIGGGRTIRGFHYRDVGPKVMRQAVDEEGNAYTDHKSVGGQSLAMASAEYSIPVVPKIRLAGFYDIGNVWRDAFDFPLSNLAAGAGVGLRFDIPGFPIRIDYAWPIQKDDDLTETDRWVFWIGYDL